MYNLGATSILEESGSDSRLQATLVAFNQPPERHHPHQKSGNPPSAASRMLSGRRISY